MFTSLDKAYAAAIFGVLSILNLTLGTHFDLSPTLVTWISVGLAAITPYVVWQIPNRTFVQVPASTEVTSPTLTEPSKPAEVIKPTKKAVAEVKRRGNWKNAPKG